MDPPSPRSLLTVLVLVLGPALAVHLDSKIDLDSEETAQTTTTPPLKAFVDLQEGNGRAQTISGVSRQATFRTIEFPRIGDQKKRKRLSVQEDSSKQPTVINNIQIVVNGNETQPEVGSCKSNVCNVSVSSRSDDNGNVVTDVHLSIVTKLNEENQVGDIPVFDGTRGLDIGNNRPSDFQAWSYPQMPHFYVSVPQIQTRSPDINEVWYRGHRSFRPAQGGWRHQTSGGSFRGGWPSGRGFVDDKIEPPLSRTRTTTSE